MNTNNTASPNEFFGGRKTKNDIIFIIILLALSLSFGAGYYFLRGEGDCVEVLVDGKLTGEYPLSRELRLEIHGEGGVNTLVIEDGHARIEYADCPDGICSAHKPISRSGESIVCLPHKVAVTVKAKDTGSSDVDIAA